MWLCCSLGENTLIDWAPGHGLGLQLCWRVFKYFNVSQSEVGALGLGSFVAPSNPETHSFRSQVLTVNFCVVGL